MCVYVVCMYLCLCVFRSTICDSPAEALMEKFTGFERVLAFNLVYLSTLASEDMFVTASLFASALLAVALAVRGSD